MVHYIILKGWYHNIIVLICQSLGHFIIIAQKLPELLRGSFSSFRNVYIASSFLSAVPSWVSKDNVLWMNWIQTVLSIKPKIWHETVMISSHPLSPWANEWYWCWSQPASSVDLLSSSPKVALEFPCGHSSHIKAMDMLLYRWLSLAPFIMVHQQGHYTTVTWISWDWLHMLHTCQHFSESEEFWRYLNINLLKMSEGIQRYSNDIQMLPMVSKAIWISCSYNSPTMCLNMEIELNLHLGLDLSQLSKLIWPAHMRVKFLISRHEALGE